MKATLKAIACIPLLGLALLVMGASSSSWAPNNFWLRVMQTATGTAARAALGVGSSDVVTNGGFVANGGSDETNSFGTTTFTGPVTFQGVGPAEFGDTAVIGILYLLDGSVKTVTFGAADSGGTGYKLLRIPN